MLFNSFNFIGFLIISFVVYYIPRLSKYQVSILIASSLIFYSFHNIPLVILLLVSVGINVVTSFVIANKKANNIKLIAWLGVISNLLILSFFKYAGLISFTFLNDNSIGEFLISIPLPIGISFFTFQGISLVVDVHKEKHFKNKEIISESILEHAKNSLFFISFFPQLVAGPIVKAHEFLPQIKVKRLKEINWEKCFKEIILGYFLKMVVADNLKDFTFWITFPFFSGKDSFTLITMLFGFSCQIFADFAGYSLIAIGIARLFGYNLNDNFNFPYISSSFQEFWKRWHISLSSFLQEYLYIPLGGNRKGKVRMYINLLITMILGGLWHGASWSFAVWGAFHGIALAIERLITQNIKLNENRIIKLIKILFVFSMVSIAWLLFKLPEFSHALKYFEKISINFDKNIDVKFITRILIYSSPVILYHLYYQFGKKKNKNYLDKYKFIIYGVMIFLILTNSGGPGDFIYFQF